ncbi:Universal stress protein/MSMEI_3859 [Methylophilaceae bacterium]|nr:Universal stress protein/MSMEI_3859 [Methylophilaceae bacterium]
MRSILIPVDGSKHALSAVKHAISIVQDGIPAHIHVINVQPVIIPLSDFYDYELIEKAQHDEAERALQSACKLLDKAGIKYSKAVKIGAIASTIIDYGKSHKCGWIIMGTRGMGSLSSLIMGSTSNRVIHLAKIPVTLVK